MKVQVGFLAEAFFSVTQVWAGQEPPLDAHHLTIVAEVITELIRFEPRNLYL